MTILFFYVAVGVLILALAVFLARQGRDRNDAETEGERELNRSLLDRSGLELAQRIFDPSDYRWLRDELRFPHLARSLAHHRRALALHWLRDLRNSFNESVRSSQSEAANTLPDDNPSSWALLFITLRFHFLLGYAVLVVRWFGPYHRLVPSFGSLHSASGVETQDESYGMANAGG